MALSWYRAAEQHGTLPFIQLSDCHLKADPAAEHLGVQPYAYLQQILAQCRHIPHQGLIITGDIREDHTDAPYQWLHDLLHDWPQPVFCLAGNHDDATRLAQICQGGAFRQELGIQLPGWRLCLLDTSMGEDGDMLSELRQNRGAGVLPLPRADVLQRQLAVAAEQGDAAWIFCHHHPLRLGQFIDIAPQLDAPRLWHVLQQAPHCQGIAHGHCHQAYQRQIAPAQLTALWQTAADEAWDDPRLARAEAAISPMYAGQVLKVDAELAAVQPCAAEQETQIRMRQPSDNHHDSTVQIVGAPASCVQFLPSPQWQWRDDGPQACFWWFLPTQQVRWQFVLFE
jgi:Icc protein